MELVTTAEAGALLKARPRTVQRIVERGKLTPVKRLPGPFGAMLFDRAEVEALARILWAAA